MNIFDKLRLKLVGGWGGILELLNENKRLEGELQEAQNKIAGYKYNLSWYTMWGESAYDKPLKLNRELRELKHSVKNIIFWADLTNINYKYLYETKTEYCDYISKRWTETEEELESIKTSLEHTKKEYNSSKANWDRLKEHYEDSIKHNRKDFQETINRIKREHSDAMGKLHKKYSDTYLETFELKEKISKYESGGKSKEYIVVPPEEGKIVSRNDTQYLSWRQSVLKRDGVCQCCGSSHNLEVHHIFSYKDYPELRINNNNGIVLCKDCHNKYHARYGRDGTKNNAITLYSFIRDNAIPVNHSLFEYTEDKSVSYGK